MSCGDFYYSLDGSDDGHTFFDFNVDSLEDAKNQLLEMGSKVLFEIPGKKLFFEDPHGMKFRLGINELGKENQQKHS